MRADWEKVARDPRANPGVTPTCFVLPTHAVEPGDVDTANSFMAGADLLGSAKGVLWKVRKGRGP